MEDALSLIARWQELIDHFERRARNRPFNEVEEEIDALPLDSDRKSALWLVALANAPEPERRRLTRGWAAHCAPRRLAVIEGMA